MVLIMWPYLKVQNYADNICIILRKDYATLQQDVDFLGVWSLNHLSFNPAKCKFMVLSQNKVKTTPPPLNLLDSEIEKSNPSSILA